MRIEFDDSAFEDLAWWVRHDRKTALKILKLIRECARTPRSGTGKPEPLRHGLTGYWSRRVDTEHRLVYRWDDTALHILSCRYHYE